MLRQVGTTFVVPNGRLYTPIDGAVAVPTVDRDIPILGCARAAVLKRANTVATIVVSFMWLASFLTIQMGDNRKASIKISFR